MRTAASIAALAWRQSRFARRRLALFLCAVSLGVAALVSVEAFRLGVDAGMGRGARRLLGADAVISSRRAAGPATEALLDSLAGAGERVSRVTSFVSMAANPVTGATRLSRVRAVEGGWPFYGQAVTAPAGAWRELSGLRDAVADPGLPVALGVRPGDSLALGEARFRLAGVLEELPGEPDVSSAFAPRLFIPAAALDDTRLLGFGSRVEHEAFLAFRAEGAGEALTRHYGATLRGEWSRLRTARDAQDDLDETLGRLGTFLRLLGLVALLVGGLGVASALSAYMAHEAEAVATLRCLGATSAQVVGVYLLQAVGLGLVGTALGVVAGLLASGVLPDLLGALLPVAPEPSGRGRAVALGFAAGTLTSAASALLPVLRTRRVPPLAALRPGAAAAGRPDPVQAAAAAGLALAFLALAAWEAGGLARGLALAGGVAGAVTALRGAAWLAARAARRLAPSRAAFGVRHGVAALRRPGGGTSAVVAGLGLGVLLLATLLVLQATLLAPLRRAVEGARADLVLWDVQPDQEAGVAEILRARGLPLLQRAPIVPMRIAEVEGRGASELAARAPGSGWALRREYRSTYRDTVVGSERLASGRWWERASPEGEPWPVSLESGIAEELGVEIGSRIDWDVQGVIVRSRVTSLREVDWARFEPNFFAVFPPAALEGAPHTVVLLTRTGGEAESARLQRDLVARFSNVAALDLARVQATVDDVVGRVAGAIRFLAGFSLAAGLVVLAGALSTTRLQRLREAVLLRALGADRRQLRTALVVEHALLGAIASAAGVLLAGVAGWGLARFALDAPLHVPVASLAALAALTTSLAVGLGLLAGAEAFRGTAMQALRED